MPARTALLCSLAVLLTIVGTGTALAECDTAPPTLTVFTTDKTSVNVTSGPQNVACTMSFTDPLTGVSQATCQLSYSDPINMVYQSQSCTATTPSSGTPQNGTYSCTITIPRYAAQGAWQTSVSAEDGVGNSTSWQSYQLPPGSPMAVTVTSDPDIVAPAFGTITLNPTSVNVSSSAQNVTCTMPLTDAKSGVNMAICAVAAPSGSSAQGQSCLSNTPASGTRNNGTFSCTITIPRYSDAATWATQVVAIDAVGNMTNVLPPATLTVTSSPEDVTAPGVTFDFNPKSVDSSAGPSIVTCTFTTTDSPAGVNFVSCSFSVTDYTTYPPVQQTQSCTSGTPSSGTRNNGTFTCNVVIPQSSAGGAWSTEIMLNDMVGNSETLPQATPLMVDCGAGTGTEPNIRFTNKTTLVWDPLAGATRYNTYRGGLTGMVDNNYDGLPDGGYGTCQNSRDANLTDTQFVDADVPTVTQKGFDYLVDYISGGIEQGLGSTSDGIPRSVAPCP